jgi:hypothetical protein
MPVSVEGRWAVAVTSSAIRRGPGGSRQATTFSSEAESPSPRSSASSVDHGDAVARCRSGILAVAEARGATSHYHATITTAWAAIMREASRGLPGADVDAVLRALAPDRAPLPG